MTRKRYNVVIPTEIGMLIVNHNDQGTADTRYGVFWQLSQTGNFEPAEISLLQKLAGLCPPNPVIMDIGANIGVVSIAIANAVDGAKIFAFEPQRIIFQMLAGNMALNSIENVFCFHMAVGDTQGLIPIPKVDYGAMASFGSLEFGRTAQTDAGQNARLDGPDIEAVPIITIDSLRFPRVDLMKIDVEGMEEAVLNGARNTIAAARPILCVEVVKSGRQIAGLLASFGYDLFPHGQNVICLRRDHPIHREARKLFM